MRVSSWGNRVQRTLRHQFATLLPNAKAIENRLKQFSATWCVQKATTGLEITNDITIIGEAQLISLPLDVYLQSIVMAIQEWSCDLTDAIDVSNNDLASQPGKIRVHQTSAISSHHTTPRWIAGIS